MTRDRTCSTAWRSCAEPEAVPPVAPDRLTPLTVAAARRNDAAFAASADCGPTNATSRPPSTGASTPFAVKTRFTSALASRSRPAGRAAATNAARARARAVGASSPSTATNGRIATRPHGAARAMAANTAACAR